MLAGGLEGSQRGGVGEGWNPQTTASLALCASSAGLSQAAFAQFLGSP